MEVSNTGVKAPTFTAIIPSNPNAMKTALAKQPLSACLDVVDSFFDYSSGIYAATDCSNTTTSHAIAIVGWGTNSESIDYWILKNSYGTGWGN